MLISGSSAALWALALPFAAAKSLWSDSPGDYSSFISTAFPLGNGRLGGSYFDQTSKGYYGRILKCSLAMPVGSYDKEIVNLNVDSLWRGGPFESPVRGACKTRINSLRG